MVPAVQIAVGRLGAGEIVDDGVDLRLDVSIAPMGEGVARRLDPLADIGVPEHLHGEAVAVARDRQRRDGLRQLERIEDARPPRASRAGSGWCAQHDFEPLAPEGPVMRDIGERNRGIVASLIVASRFCPRRSRAAESRTTSEHGSRRTPSSARPAIISMQRRAGFAPERIEVHIDAGQRRPRRLRPSRPNCRSRPPRRRRDGEPEFAQRVDRAARDLIVAAEERVRRAGAAREKRLRPPRAPRPRTIGRAGSRPRPLSAPPRPAPRASPVRAGGPPRTAPGR